MLMQCILREDAEIRFLREEVVKVNTVEQRKKRKTRKEE